MHRKVGGFEAGADDYMTKPFDVPELLVRVRALLSRATVGGPPRTVVLDPAKHAVTHGSASGCLTPTEFRLLGRLIASQGDVVRRHALVAAGWPHGAYVSDNTLDSYVRRLRTELAVLVVVSHVLLSRVISTDAHDLARTRAEAVAANVTVRDGQVEPIENGSEALDTVAWVYADGRLVDGIVPDGALGPISALAGSGRAQGATVDNSLLSSCTSSRPWPKATPSRWSFGWT